MRRLLPLLTSVAAIATATVATVAISSSASAAPAVGKYVALGDSYAAVGSLDEIHGDPIGCARARDNYRPGWPPASAQPPSSTRPAAAPRPST